MASRYLKVWRKNHNTAVNLALYSSDTSSDESVQDSCSENRVFMHSPQSENESLSIPEIVDSSESECEGSDNEADGDVLKEPTFMEQIADWAGRNNIRRNALNELLAILRQHTEYYVPKDGRTLLKTPRVTPIVNKCGGQYIYFGIASGVLKELAHDASIISDSNDVALVVNVDGLPIYKSSSREFWPILCSFSMCTPFIVALYYGRGKPESVEEFLRDFLEEYENLKEHSLQYSGTTVTVSIKAFICDAPARSFLKCVKGHTAFEACERCTIKGVKKENRTVLYSNYNCTLRTNEQFQKLQYKDHQLKASPLTSHSINCIQTFPLEYMHLVCLGVVRRMLYFWKCGPRHCRLSCGQISAISDHLLSFTGKLPSEFVCQPRSLSELERWKATEYRQFLLYTGPIVLRKVLSEHVYETFLCLSVAISILLDESENRRREYLGYARELLNTFVRKSLSDFGDIFVVYNVHNLLHIADDVEHFDCSLNALSAFPFENHLQALKRIIRCGRNPLSQVWRRVYERQQICSVVPKKHRKLHVSPGDRNGVYMLENGDVAFVQEQLERGQVECRIFRECDTEDFFVKPCKSKLLDIVFVKKECRSTRKSLLYKDLKHKAVCLPYSAGHVVFPLLHDAEK